MNEICDTRTTSDAQLCEVTSRTYESVRHAGVLLNSIEVLRNTMVDNVIVRSFFALVKLDADITSEERNKSRDLLTNFKITHRYNCSATSATHLANYVSSTNLRIHYKIIYVYPIPM